MERFFCAAILSAPDIGVAKASKLISFFGSAREAWKAPESSMISPIGEDAAASLCKFQRSHADLPDLIASACEKKHISVCAKDDAEYPGMLREIFSAPLVLFYKGKLVPDANRIALVGARRATLYGKRVAEDIARDLAKAGVTVVSGAARGIDSAAHAGALLAGRTVAVLGCGVDVVYPKENEKLLDEIAEKGAVISEYAPGTQPLPSLFPMRNRIISGLSSGVVVVEAADRSGSLITAELALSSGRDVFAVPGAIYSEMSRGPNRLIQEGAKLVRGVRDILDEYGWIRDARKKTTSPLIESLLAGLSAEARTVYSILSDDVPLTIDEIVYGLHGKGDASNVAFLLLSMQLRGIVTEDENHAYVRAALDGVPARSP